jgi:hypothetical protein
MLRRLEVLAGVSMRRVVAAADVAAGAAQAQVHPFAADFQALLAADGARDDIPNRVQMRTSFFH